MAIEEIREIFDVTLMKKHPEFENQRVIQKWFPGEHGCVGGGTEEHSGLAVSIVDCLGKCAHCRLFFHDGEEIEIDHKVPRSKSGKDSYDNLQLRERTLPRC